MGPPQVRTFRSGGRRENGAGRQTMGETQGGHRLQMLDSYELNLEIAQITVKKSTLQVEGTASAHGTGLEGMH